ncbi:MAG: hypothetical protein JW875_00345 [Spirochaetales bacterium]|nr:hypothetical protein [Spirochaetales bacterium]
MKSLQRRVLCYLMVIITVLLVSSCVFFESDDDDDDDESQALGVVRVVFSDSEKTIPWASPINVLVTSGDSWTVTLNGLDGRNVFVVKTNAAGQDSAAGMNGSVTSYTLNNKSYSVKNRSAVPQSFSPSRAFRLVSGKSITRLDHEGSRRMTANSTLAPISSRSASARSSFAPSAMEASRAVANVGDVQSFWVESKAGPFIQIQAQLRDTGDHCAIWVPDSHYASGAEVANDNRVSPARITAMKNAFDSLYSSTVALYGYEWGGNPLDTDNLGGVDQDERIQILVYDIGSDFEANQSSGILGFFWGKDYYPDSYTSSYDPAAFGSSYTVRSNEAEIFYVDAHFTDFSPSYVYSTLVHEFQHMINFNVKSRPVADGGKGLLVSTWCNEMLSLLAEDVIGLKIGLDPKVLPRASRFPLFLCSYQLSGVTDWLSGDEVYFSYAGSYAFGAYLVRNFGGAALIQKIMQSPYTDQAAISHALSQLYPDTFGTFSTTASHAAFIKAFKKYSEAFVYSGKAVQGGYNASLGSFDRDIIGSPVSGSSQEYSFRNIDPWTIENPLAGQFSDIPVGTKGPLVWELGNYGIVKYGVDLQSDARWQNVSGTLVIRGKNPVNAHVTVTVLVR